MSASVTVSRHDLLEALKMFKKLLRRSAAEALVYLDGDDLVIDMGGMATSVPAKGNWRGKAVVPASFILTLARFPPLGDPVEIRVEADTFAVQTSRVPCRWQDISWTPIEVPMDAPQSFFLNVALKCSPAEILNSGLDKAIAEAERKRDALIAKAAEVLQRLDVEPLDIRKTIDRCVQRRWGK